MIEHRLRVTIVPADDSRFVQRLQDACAAIVAGQIELDSRVAADWLQFGLRAGGFPNAVVEYERTADDILAARATWIVRRDGPTH